MDLGFPVTRPVSPGGAGPPAAHHAGSPEGQQPHGPYRGDVTSVTVSHITTLQADVCTSSRGGSRGSGTLRGPGHQQVGAGARGGPARGVTACCSLTPSRPGFNTYLPLPEDRTGRRLAVPHPDTPRLPRGSSQHHATPCRSADEPPPTHARNRATYTGPETRVRGGRGLVRGAVLRGGVRRLVLEERLRRPVLGAPLPLRRGARGLRVAGAARANEGLERQRERPSHLGRRATLTPEAAATATDAPAPGP